MKGILKRTGFVAALVGLLCLGSLLSDRVLLRTNLVRLHVVGASDSDYDQAVKLQVRDAVLNSLRETMQQATDVQAAKAYITERLPQLEQTANDTLAALGYDGKAVVSFCKEAFPLREYDLFSLPAGVYNALRVTIGAGEGRNWWCVIYPALCDSLTTVDLSQTAACADFPDLLTDTITQKSGTQYRFYLLDKLGQWENRLFAASRPGGTDA